MDWFGSLYYQKLYRHRSLTEARQFIDSLIDYLKPAPSSRVVDVCCGRGRHSLYLSHKGFNVWGIDKSQENIDSASGHQMDNLHFIQGDIRSKFEIPTMDLAFNLFTSFGYFDSDEDNLLSLKNIRDCLVSGGTLVLDYLNEQKAVDDLIPIERREIDGIAYEIKRQADHKFITKQIHITHEGQTFDFIEQVRRYRALDFEWLLGQSGFETATTFGNYALERFDVNHSDRLILCAKAI